MRELSIRLFKQVVETVVGSDKRRMKKKVRRGLLPLYFHTHDETDSVAKVEIPKLASDTGQGNADPLGIRDKSCWQSDSGSVRHLGVQLPESQRTGRSCPPSRHQSHHCLPHPPVPLAAEVEGEVGSPPSYAPSIPPSSSAALSKGPCRTSASRGREAGVDISNACPTWSSRAQQQPVATEA